MSELDATSESDERAHTAAGSPTLTQSVWRSRSRWLVHLGLLVTVVGAIVTLQFVHIRVAFHTVVGLVFGGFVIVHLAQRRRTVASLASHFAKARSLVERRVRLAGSDLLLAFITLNVLVSGILEWTSGTQVLLPLPAPFDRWHGASGIALVVYLAVHVWHRRKRLRRSMIR